ncbi:MAG: hypothetical protein BGO76_06960 [Caedibacter sp. 38-128]|nr:TraB/GumN family protein [Holosporales bacterium]OJX04753.1 MAG: hypothetical protein BGO76_06960 [Caedibacter sp. 38-128]
MLNCLKNLYFILAFSQIFSTTWASVNEVEDEDFPSQAEQVRKSFIIQVKDLALPPAPRQHRPYLYKLTPPQNLTGFKKFTLLGTYHTYPHFMVPSSVLRAFSKAHHVLTESGDNSEEEDDREITKQELGSSGFIMNVPSEVERLVKRELDWYNEWYRKKIIEEPYSYKEEGKAPFLKLIQTEKEQEITKFLTDWGSSLSGEEQKYILELLTGESSTLNLTSINTLHPVALHSMLAVKSYEKPSERGIDSCIAEHARQAEKPLSGLDTDALTIETSLISIRAKINSLNFFDIAPIITDIQSFLKMIMQKKLPTFEEDMLDLAFNQYHQGNLSENLNESDVFWSNFSTLRTQAWLPKLEEHIQSKGTFVAVGLGHIPDILTWAQEKGYTVKRSKH